MSSDGYPRRAWRVEPARETVEPKRTAKRAAVGQRLSGSIVKQDKDTRAFYIALRGTQGDLEWFDRKIRALQIWTVEDVPGVPDDSFIVEYIGNVVIKESPADVRAEGSSGDPARSVPVSEAPDTVHSSVKSFVLAEEARQKLLRERFDRAVEQQAAASQLAGLARQLADLERQLDAERAQRVELQKQLAALAARDASSRSE